MLDKLAFPRRDFLRAAAFGGAGVGLAGVTPAWAQVRTLPDFTDLVEQVGPSVVNIRTLEKTKASAAGGVAGREKFL